MLKKKFSIAVAIPTFNREQILIDTIEEVLKQKYLPDEVLVIDQTKNHSLKVDNYLSQQSSAGKINWIKHFPANKPGARNRALYETKCNILIFIDDDVRLCENFVYKHLRNYMEDNKIAAVAGRISTRPFNRERCFCTYPRLLDYKNFSVGYDKREENVCTLGGANHSIRVDVALSLGGYDENFIGWAYREETDMALRLCKSDYKIVFDPEAEIKHLAAKSGGCAGRVSEFSVSFPLFYFFFKHRDLLKYDKNFFFSTCLANFNLAVLRKPIEKNFYLVPYFFIGYIVSFFRAMKIAKKAVFNFDLK